MAIIPSVENDSIDDFEDRLSVFLASSPTGSLRSAVRRAAKFIENEAEDAGLEMDHVNNATSTFCRVFNEMDDRLFKANRRIRELEAQIAAQPNAD